MPAPEIILWHKLKGNQMGVKFRRQFSVFNFILDFYAPIIKLAIEIDGDSHYRNSSVKLKDARRDQKLAGLGIKVLRYTNNEVMCNLDGACVSILHEINNRVYTTSTY